MTRLLCLVGALSATTALAEDKRAVLVAQVLDAQGVPEAVARRIQRTTEALLKQLSGLPVGEGASYKPGPRRNCSELACQREFVEGAGVPSVAVLSLRSSRGGVSFDLSFWSEGERLGFEIGQAEIDTPEPALRSALDAVLPAWAKRGWGALRLTAASGSVLKLDGRVVKLKPGELLSVPAGSHQLDVVYADGNAVLQKVEIPEGSRTQLDVRNQPVLLSGAPESSGALRAVSFGLWTAGAAAIAGGLVAGSLSRQTGVGQNPCTADSRSCSTLDVASERHRQAEAYANTGNILLGSGLGLAASGVAVFVIDLLRSPSPAETAR